jgi:hypothetical protein
MSRRIFQARRDPALLDREQLTAANCKQQALEFQTDLAGFSRQ